MALGVDVSYAQGKPNWAIVKSSGRVEFVYAKATGGLATHGPDSSFLHNWSSLAEVGIRRGAYHFYIAELDPVKQADAFFNVVGHLRDWDMPPMLDMEVVRAPNVTPQQFVKNIRAFVERAESLFKRKLVIYTGGPVFNAGCIGADAADLDFICDHDLWLSAYVLDPTKFVPKAWSDRGKTWTIWQKSGDIAAVGQLPGRFVGISNVVDVNVTQGAALNLDEWIKNSMIVIESESTMILPPPPPHFDYSQPFRVGIPVQSAPIIDVAACEPEKSPGVLGKLFGSLTALFRGAK